MGNEFAQKARPQASAEGRGHASPSLSAKTQRLVHDVLHSPGKPLDSDTRAYMEPRFRHDFSKVRVHADSNATTLAIGKPGDRFEQEADRTADQVMDASQPVAPELTQREPAQRSDTAGRSAPESVPPIVHDVLRTPGQPLEPSTRAYMEQRFGHDFSKVRIHADAKAAASARAVNAHAYAVGEHIAFGAGRYAPGDLAGRKLLAHELTHTVQQGSSRLLLARQHAQEPQQPGEWSEQVKKSRQLRMREQRTGPLRP